MALKLSDFQNFGEFSKSFTDETLLAKAIRDESDPGSSY